VAAGGCLSLHPKIVEFADLDHASQLAAVPHWKTQLKFALAPALIHQVGSTHLLLVAHNEQ